VLNPHQRTGYVSKHNSNFIIHYTLKQSVNLRFHAYIITICLDMLFLADYGQDLLGIIETACISVRQLSKKKCNNSSCKFLEKFSTICWWRLQIIHKMLDFRLKISLYVLQERGREFLNHNRAISTITWQIHHTQTEMSVINPDTGKKLHKQNSNFFSVIYVS
jgi:hypothetical protein